MKANYFFNPDTVNMLDDSSLMGLLTNYTELSKEAFKEVECDKDVLFMCEYLKDFRKKLITEAAKRKLIEIVKR